MALADDIWPCLFDVCLFVCVACSERERSRSRWGKERREIWRLIESGGLVWLTWAQVIKAGPCCNSAADLHPASSSLPFAPADTFTDVHLCVED